MVWRFAGVRPLYDDGARSTAAATRDYVFELDAADAPALSIFGGKLTTYRRLAEAALARLSVHLPGAGPPWTAAAPLPGADGLPAGGLAVLVVELGREFPACDAATVERLARLYGSDARAILAQGEEELTGGLLKSEVDWLIREWVGTRRGHSVAAHQARSRRLAGSGAGACRIPGRFETPYIGYT